MSRLLHECGSPGCRKLTRTRYCDKHTSGDNDTKQHNRERNKWDPFRALYRTVRWTLLRREVLIEHPLCNMCGLAASTICDHVIPARVYAAADPERFYDRKNLQGICKPCHDAKTQREKEQYGLASQVGRASL